MAILESSDRGGDESSYRVDVGQALPWQFVNLRKIEHKCPVSASEAYEGASHNKVEYYRTLIMYEIVS